MPQAHPRMTTFQAHDVISSSKGKDSFETPSVQRTVMTFLRRESVLTSKLMMILTKLTGSTLKLKNLLSTIAIAVSPLVFCLSFVGGNKELLSRLGKKAKNRAARSVSTWLPCSKTGVKNKANFALPISHQQVPSELDLYFKLSRARVPCFISHHPLPLSPSTPSSPASPSSSPPTTSTAFFHGRQQANQAVFSQACRSNTILPGRAWLSRRNPVSFKCSLAE